MSEWVVCDCNWEATRCGQLMTVERPRNLTTIFAHAQQLPKMGEYLNTDRKVCKQRVKTVQTKDDKSMLPTLKYMLCKGSQRPGLIILSLL